jgi:hypothetical protein
MVQQRNAAINADGTPKGLRLTRAGQLFTADWKTELVLAGLAYNVSVGDISAGAAEALITGGGDGTVIDTDQPEMAIGTPAGFYHIPLGFTAAGRVDFDADAETAEIVLFADLVKSIPQPVIASSTLETPQNLLDGGRASVSFAQSAVTTDITDVVLSMLLGISLWQASEITAAGAHDMGMRLDYAPSFPTLLKGPCSVVACWGGTAAVAGACSYNWAEVPVERFE